MVLDKLRNGKWWSQEDTEILTETPVFSILNSFIVEADCEWKMGMDISRIKLESAFKLDIPCPEGIKSSNFPQIRWHICFVWLQKAIYANLKEKGLKNSSKKRIKKLN